MEPKIRIKGSKSSWETFTIGEISSSSKGNGYSKSDLTDKGTPIVLYGRMYTKYSPKIDELDTFANPKDGSVYSEGGEIIIPGSGETPEDIAIASHIANKGVIIGGDLNILKFNQQEFDPTFLALSISNGKTHNELSRYAQGKTVVHLRNSDIAKGHITCPSIYEQKAISEYFGSLDKVIQSTSKKIESFKQVKAASMQSMFPQEGETEPCIRFKGFEGEWVKSVVGDLGTTYSGLSGKTKEDFGKGDAKYITFLNVLTNAKIDTSILEAVNVCEGERQNKVQRGDLLFNTSSETPEEVGMCAVMDENMDNVYLNSFCFGFRLTDTNTSPLFISYILRSHIGRRLMSILAQGATRYNLSKTSFCKATILLPSTKEEQQMIADYFANLDSQITLQSQRLEKLKQIKAACLDNMFV